MRLKFPALLFLPLFLLPCPAQALDLNSYRAQHGRPALQYDASLTGLAYAHAADLARRGALDHAGFLSQRGPAGARAENVSFGCGDQACAIRQWAASGRHRANMLRSDVTRYGLASAASGNGQRYWVMELGGAPPVRVKRVRGRAYLEQAPPYGGEAAPRP